MRGGAVKNCCLSWDVACCPAVRGWNDGAPDDCRTFAAVNGWDVFPFAETDMIFIPANCGALMSNVMGPFVMLRSVWLPFVCSTIFAVHTCPRLGLPHLPQMYPSLRSFLMDEADLDEVDEELWLLALAFPARPLAAAAEIDC